MDKKDSNYDRVTFMQFFVHNRGTKVSLSFPSTAVKGDFDISYEDTFRKTIRRKPNTVVESGKLFIPSIEDSTFVSWVVNAPPRNMPKLAVNKWTFSDGSLIKYTKNQLINNWLDLIPVDITNRILSFMNVRDVFNCLITTNLKYNPISKHYTDWMEVSDLGLYYRISDKNTSFWIISNSQYLVSRMNNSSINKYIPIEVSRHNGTRSRADVAIVILTVLSSMAMNESRVDALRYLFDKEELMVPLERLRIAHTMDIKSNDVGKADCDELALNVLRLEIIKYHLQLCFNSSSRTLALRMSDDLHRYIANDPIKKVKIHSRINRSLHIPRLEGQILICKYEPGREYLLGGMHPMRGFTCFNGFFNGYVDAGGRLSLSDNRWGHSLDNDYITYDIGKIYDQRFERESDDSDMDEGDGDNDEDDEDDDDVME